MRNARVAQGAAAQNAFHVLFPFIILLLLNNA